MNNFDRNVFKNSLYNPLYSFHQDIQMQAFKNKTLWS